MWKKATIVFTKKTQSKVPLSRSSRRHSIRVSLKHGGRRGTTEEQHAAPWWHEEYTKFVHVVHRTARTHGRATRSTMMLNSFIHSTTIRYEVFQWIHHEGRRGGREAFSS
jgi:hypothetical protein